MVSSVSPSPKVMVVSNEILVLPPPPLPPSPFNLPKFVPFHSHIELSKPTCCQYRKVGPVGLEPDVSFRSKDRFPTCKYPGYLYHPFAILLGSPVGDGG